MLALFGVAFLFKEEVVLFSRMWLLMFTASATMFVVAKHVAWRRRVYRGAATHQRRTVALLGARQQNQEIAQLIARHAEWGISVAAQLDLNEYSDESLVEALHEHHVECVMLTTGKLSFDRIGQAIAVCETEGVDVLLMADFVRPAIARISFDQFAQRPVLLFSCKPDRAWHLLIKRVIDFVGAFCVLLIAGPLIMLPVAIAIRLTSKGPILFRQNRCGLHGKTFSMLKFRSMVANAEELRTQPARAERAERPRIQDRARSANHAPRPNHPQNEHRRAAAAIQYPLRRYEPRRPAPADSERSKKIRLRGSVVV